MSLSIHDVITYATNPSTYLSIDQYIPCDVRTVCFGMAASMGAFLLSAGTKGKRKSLPNSRIMIHQPLGGSQGEATDLEISAKLILHTKDVLNTYLSAFCDQPMDKLRLDTDRDFYMTPEEALSYGIIDEVIQHKNMIKTPKIPSLKVIMSVVLCMQCMMLTVSASVCLSVCLSLLLQVASPLSIYDVGSIARKPVNAAPVDRSKNTWS